MPGEAAPVASVAKLAPAVLPAGSTVGKHAGALLAVANLVSAPLAKLAVARSVGKCAAGILALAMLAVGKDDGDRANDVRNTTFHFCFLNTAMHA